jgi:hypothetical protein
VQDNAENALEAATEPEGELEETKASLDADTPTVCHPASCSPISDSMIMPACFQSAAHRCANPLWLPLCSLVSFSALAQVPGGADEWGPAGGGEMGSVDEADVEKQERSEVQERWADNIEQAPSSDSPAEPHSADTDVPSGNSSPAAEASAPASASVSPAPSSSALLQQTPCTQS